MLDLHAFVAADKRADALGLLDGMEGVRRATALPASADGTTHVLAEVDAVVADEVMEALG